MRGTHCKYDEHVLWSWQAAQAQAGKDPCLFFFAPDPDRSHGFWLKLQWKKFETEGHQQSEAAGHRQGLKEWHRLHGSGEEARPRTARRRSGETEGQAASRRGSNQERLCPAIWKRPFFFKPAEVQSRTKFLNGVIWGWAIDGEARKLSGATGAKRQSWAEPQERSDQVEQSMNAGATPGWTASTVIKEQIFVGNSISLLSYNW